MNREPHKNASGQPDNILSIDIIPQNATILERSSGGVVVKFIRGHCNDNDKYRLEKNGFHWDTKVKTYVNILIESDITLDDLLRAQAVRIEYVNEQHCLIMPRCYLKHDVFTRINTVMRKLNFTWSTNTRAWYKKMKRMTFLRLRTAFQQSQSIVVHQGAEEIKDRLNDLGQEQFDFDLFKKLFSDNLDKHQCRLSLAETDPIYQAASSEYGRLIQRMAMNGEYNYPDPPELPRLQQK